jgi:hypothetical protein
MAVKQGNADCGSDTLREFCIQKPILDIVKVEFIISAAKVVFFLKMSKQIYKKSDRISLSLVCT